MQVTQVRELLQKRRQELQARADRIGSDLRHEAMPSEGGFADQVAEHTNDAVLDAIRSSAESELQQIDNALSLLAQGQYGRCKTCGGEIGEQRLHSVPYATTCAGCAD